MNLLIDKYPDVASLYNEGKNERNLNTITCGSSYMAYWTCPKCGQDFIRRVSHMLDRKCVKCPICLQTIFENQKRVKVLGIKKVSDFPLLIKEWSPDNRTSPETTAAGSNKKVEWVCSTCGNRWSTAPNHRTGPNKTGCPKCAKKKRGISKTISASIQAGSIELTHPELLSKWDYNKNIIKPSEISKGSTRNVWLICSNGHSYCSTIAKAIEGRECPYCSGKKVLPGYNDFACKYPGLLTMWDSDKNDILPNEILPGSNKLVWWKCDKGHSFKRSVQYITRGRRCPICAGKEVLSGFNDFASAFPEVASEWDYDKNSPLVPNKVSAFSNKKYWWKCPQCGYSWKASASVRARGEGCGNCSKRGESIPEYIILYYLRYVGEECIHKFKPKWLNGKEIDVFIPSRNIGIEYDGLAYHKEDRDLKKSDLCRENKVKLIRMREQGLPRLNNADIIIEVPLDKYRASDKHANLKRPLIELFRFLGFDAECIDLNRDNHKIISEYKSLKTSSSLAERYPTIAEEWDFEKNQGLKPTQVKYGSQEIVWWKCKVGHSWQAVISSRTLQGCGCPFCSNQRVLKGYNDLLSKRPDIALEWSTQNAIKPDEVTFQSNKKVRFVCKKCGTEWFASISSRTLQGTGCPKCGLKKSASSRNKAFIAKRGSLKDNYPDVAKEWDNEKNEGTPDDYTSCSAKYAWWICSNGHNYRAAIQNRTRGGTGCPICAKSRKDKKETS